MQLYGQYLQIPFANYGRDWAGCDCYGFIRLFLDNEMGAVLPEYKYDADPATVELAFKNDTSTIRVHCPTLYDIIILRSPTTGMHFGVYLGNGRFIHMRENAGVTIDDINSMRWCKRITQYRRINHENVGWIE